MAVVDPLSETKAVALRFLHACFRKDPDGAVAMLSPTATWWVNGDPALLRVSGSKTQDQAVRLIYGMKKVLPTGMDHEVIGVTAEGERVAVEVIATAQWVDGSTYRNRYHFLLRVRDGMIEEVREYMDTLAVANMPGTLVPQE